MPAEPIEPRAARRSAASEPVHEGLVMLCVRVTPELRRRVKLVAAHSGRPIQALATEALERICTQHDM